MGNECLVEAVRAMRKMVSKLLLGLGQELV